MPSLAGLKPKGPWSDKEAENINNLLYSNLDKKYKVIPIITEEIKIFNISKLNFLEKNNIIESLDLAINKKRLIHEEMDVERASPTTPY